MADFEPAALTGELVRAARALLRLAIEDLASETGLGVATLRRAEAAVGPVKITRANALAIVVALDRLGIELIHENGVGVGVRVRSTEAR